MKSLTIAILINLLFLAIISFMMQRSLYQEQKIELFEIKKQYQIQNKLNKILINDITKKEYKRIMKGVKS